MLRKGSLGNHQSKLFFYFYSIFIIFLPVAVLDVAAATWDDSYFRGTPNEWSSTSMVLNSQTDLWETYQTFSDSDPRFKVSRDDSWDEAYPAEDYLVTGGVGNYYITFNDESKNIVVSKVLNTSNSVKETAICFDNLNQFQTPTIYFWTPVPEGVISTPVWPGYIMTVNGDFYCYDPDQSLTSLNVIFSDNGDNQTDNLSYDGAGCYAEKAWTSLEACGFTIEPTGITPVPNAGPDRTLNLNSQHVLSSNASTGDYSEASWTSDAWSDTLVGNSVQTPVLVQVGQYAVTLTLRNTANETFTDDFILTVVEPNNGLAERPLLTQELGFPVSGNVSTGSYEFVKAFPNLDGQFIASVMVVADGLNDLIYVVDKPGVIYVFPNQETVTKAEVVTLLDINDVVQDYHEQGLLSMAFDPDYSNNGYIYVYYINGSTDQEKNGELYGDAVLERWTVSDPSNPTQVTSNSNVEILRIAQPGPDHKGGMMQFHPVEGYLYVSIGDGAYAYSAITSYAADPRTNNNAQDTSNLLGTMIRIQPLETAVDGSYYRIPSDNPFVSDSEVRDEIWTYGHRNPWRWAFDPSSPHTLWETEVGQQDYEEVNIILKGKNYGWPVCEGLLNRGDLGGDATKDCSTDFEPPVDGYDHSGASSVIGGIIYRGSTLPNLVGHFIFGDYNSKKIWSVTGDENKTVLSDGFPENIASFGTDVSGEDLFISTYGIEFGDGSSSIYKVVDLDAESAVIPETLSKTGLFYDLETLIPSNGVIEYSINSDAWFDGALARHFIAIPNDSQIDFNTTDTWQLPLGSVLVKHFDFVIDTEGNTKPFTTSVLFRQDSGWQAANYQWNSEANEATLVTTVSTQTVQHYVNGALVEREHTVLSSSECGSCHTGNASKNPLAIDTRQWNREFNYQGVSDNQIDVFNHISMFSETISSSTTHGSFVDPEDTTQDIGARAKSYLHSNCAHCHSSDFMDLTYDTALIDMKIVNVETSGEQYRLKPFDANSSLIYLYQTTDSNRMPKGSHYTNPLAQSLFEQWITAADAVQTGILITTESNTIKSGSSVSLQLNQLFSNGFTATPESEVSWNSSDTSVVSLTQSTSASVNATALSAGTVLVSANEGGFSDDIQITVEAGPTAPSHFTASPLSSSIIELAWVDNSDDETLFYLQRSTSSQGAFEEIATLTANSASYVDSGLLSATDYFYELLAISDDGLSLPVYASASTEDLSSIDSLLILPNDVLLFEEGAQQLFAIASESDQRKGVSYEVVWSSSDESVATVSSTGLITAGSVSGSATITASLNGVSTQSSVDNQGVGKYVYFEKPVDWADAYIWAWSDIDGVLTNKTGGVWPGLNMELAPEFGGTWYRFAITEAMYDSGDTLNIVFNCGSGDCQTGDVSTSQNSSSWYSENVWLDLAPLGGSTPIGTQIQVGNGSITLASAQENLSGKLFTPNATVDIAADDPGPGKTFVGWEGSGAALLLNAKSTNTQMIVEDILSITLLAVFDSVVDNHEAARSLYQTQCVGCHGSTGAGSTSLADVINSYSLAELIAYINDNMPYGAVGDCTGDCANGIAAMIYDNAYLPPVGVCDADSLDDLIPQDRSYRLLTAHEYNNTIRDLIGSQSDIDVTTDTVPLDIAVNGFKTDANTVFTNDHSKGYVVAAQAAADKVDSVFDLTPECSNIECFIGTFGKKAFRRPLVATEQSSLLSLYSSLGEQALLVGIFSSPALLYRSEIGEEIVSGETQGFYQLTDYEVASLLSYTYWATTPDEELVAAADAGQLNTPAQIQSQVQRLLDDDRAKVAFERFVNGWLNLNKNINADIDENLKADMKQETLRFLEAVVFGNGSYEELLSADYSYMTSALAEHYGLPWPGGSGWQQVYYSGENSERRGILGHASILTLQSTSESTHPVKRGLFVRRNLLCQDFPPPPVGADLSPTIDPSHTVRERFEEHQQDSCNTCHQYIDGIGFGLEAYSNIGLFRTMETTGDNSIRTIDASGYIGSLDSAETFLSESSPVLTFSTLSELSHLIADSSNGRACYVRQWFRYTRGQREQVEDSCTLDVIGKTFKGTQGSSLLELMTQLSQTKNYILRK